MTFLVFSLAKPFLSFSCISRFHFTLNIELLLVLLIYKMAFIVAFFPFYCYVKSAAHLPEIPQETVNECKARLEKNPSKDLFMDCTR